MFFNEIKIAGKTYAAIPCTAYLPTIDETEADRRDMMIVDANAYADADETDYTLIPEYIEDGEEITEWDATWSTDCDDLGTAIHDGEWFSVHDPHTDDERHHDETEPVKALINAYGDANGMRESVDILEVVIPSEAFLHNTDHHLIAEVVIDRLHLLKDDYIRMKGLKAVIDENNLDTHEFENALDEIEALNLDPDDLDNIEVYDEMENYPALCEMICDVMETLAHRLIKPVIIPLSKCGGEDLVVEPVKPYDDEDHSFDDDQIIKDVKVETI